FQSFKNDSGERNLVFLSNKIEPFSTLETAPLFDDLKKELTRKKVLHPGFTASYCWTPVARGCDVVTISCEGSDPLLYIPPVLTFLQSGNCYTALPNKYGVRIYYSLILCPGWKKAQLVFEQLKIYGRCSRQLHPMLIILGQKKEDVKRVRIRGCNVLVTTPHSFLRLFEHHSLLFCRLCHLILDEVDVLFCSATEQVFSILDCYKKAFFPEILEYSPHQIIAVGTHWNKHITHLIKEFMNDPYIVITAMEEASIYGNVHQVVQLCMNSDRIAVLLKILDFNHSNIQKMLVFTNSVDEAEMVHKALKSKSVVALKIHKESLSNLKYILEQWTKKHSSGTQVVLVLTDDCMQALGITDATCVVHFSFPSPRIFGQRLHTMSDNFCNLIKDSSVGQEYMKAKSVILLTENSERDALGMLYYMQHAEAEIPPELHDLTAKMLEAEEDTKCSRPLCTYLKTFGICKNRKVCPDRHRINLQTDLCQNIPAIRTSGYVTILPLHIVNATNYFGRIVDKQKDQYTILAEEINDYFKKPSNKISVKNVEKLALYGLCEKMFFHRVQVVEILAKEEGNLFFSVKVKYIDEGRTSRVQNHHLLHLPAEFQCLPPQAVEFIVCRVKPIDDEIEWNPEVVTHFINQKIKGKVHEAKIVHTLGNTVWVDPMVRVTRISDLKMSVNEYNVRSEILSTGLATDNAEHITQLQKLCRRAEVTDNAKNLEPLMKEDISVPENLSNLQNMSSQEHFTENCNSSAVTLGNHLCDGVAQTKISEETTLHQHKCFYPQIKWFQNEETVTVKVKVASVADCNCEFSKEKVIFRACSGDKLYLADMDLHHCILPEKSTYVIKDKEAVIVLMKEKKEAWSKLLKNKNLHVSLDFEHWEAFEDKSPFPDGTE
ncbi:DBP2 helicase, partial [Rhinopomastus cyanomelas]|nr:DBP2 helicase [Rhinopomastus cyanomelas]